MKTLYPFRVAVEWADTEFGPHESTEQIVYATSAAKALKLHTRLVGRIPADALDVRTRRDTGVWV